MKTASIFGLFLKNHTMGMNPFEYAFFIQPILGYGSKTWTDEEKIILDGQRAIQVFMAGQNYSRIEFIDLAYTMMLPEVITQPNLYDLTMIFNEVEKLVFIDYVHTTPEANHIIAKAMLEYIHIK